jgi:NADH:ubiquinone oxidoreductase subunit D
MGKCVNWPVIENLLLILKMWWMDLGSATIVLMIPAENLNFIKTQQQVIIDRLNALVTQPVQNKIDIPENYITAIEFMDAVRIRRSKFDELVADNKIKIIRRKERFMCLLPKKSDTSKIPLFNKAY